MANKSKRFRMRANKSRKNKRGGKKNHSLLTTQMAGSKISYNTLLSQYGGQQIGGAPAPAPSSGYPFNLGSIEPTSLANALQQFGDAVQSFVYTGTSTNAATTAAEQAVAAQRTASNNLQSDIDALRNAYFGANWTDDTGTTQTTDVTVDGLYRILKGEMFRATATAPAPAPKPAPA